MEQRKKWMTRIEARIIDGSYKIKETLSTRRISERMEKYGEEISRMTTETNLADTWFHCSERLEIMDENVLQAGIYELNFYGNNLCASISTGKEIGRLVILTMGLRLSNNETGNQKKVLWRTNGRALFPTSNNWEEKGRESFIA